MNSVKKASIPQSNESSNLTITEACIMAIAMITALSLQAHAKSQNRQLAANLESDFESLTECKTSEMKISNQVGQ
ncbi:hypothetical protein [Lyngbya sp. PCC 8106]|uniref:hypothetical protein n=1 Tax=Lyngbya sp. (strain PCC 8106) TaxID=313612 RepID=UPI0000EAB75C|nr:hypothetical protein [Lyngbya sp. PCC 8106]EAW36476.1 hypothetical protein L8106_11642 [Lyngbya sp. PCC 8106]